MEYIIDEKVIARYWRKVNKNGPVVAAELGPCWEWTGSKQGVGIPLLTEAQVLEARTIRCQGLEYREVARRTGIPETAISSVLQNKTWKHVPFVNADYEDWRKTHCKVGHRMDLYQKTTTKQNICFACTRKRATEWARAKRGVVKPRVAHSYPTSPPPGPRFEP